MTQFKVGDKAFSVQKNEVVTIIETFNELALVRLSNRAIVGLFMATLQPLEQASECDHAWILERGFHFDNYRCALCEKTKPFNVMGNEK